ncbi:MAG: hypothetical protein GYB68_15875 [Chloroflexi bacterium]|nr:hypothetical protein [Chloroflexota bacterium]
MQRRKSAVIVLTLVFTFAFAFFAFPVPDQVAAAPEAAPIQELDEDVLFTEIEGNFDVNVHAAERSRFVLVNMAMLPTHTNAQNLPAVMHEQIELNLFDDVVITAELERSELGYGGVVNWVGRIDGSPFSEVSLSMADDHMIGRITTPNGDVYRVEYMNGGVHGIHKIDTSQFPTGSGEPAPPPSALPEDPLSMIQGDDGSQVDVMFVYTTTAATVAGNITTSVNDMVTRANTANSNSGVPFTFNLVGLVPVNYADNQAPSGAVFENALIQLAETSDGVMDEVHTQRNQLGADLVVMLFQTNKPQSGLIICGLAFTPFAIDASNASVAFSVNDIECAQSTQTATHEMGHNFGLFHDRANVSGGTPALPYAYGYQDPNGTFHTIMAYGFNGSCGDGSTCQELNYWSTPNLQLNGTPLGVAGEGPTASNNTLAITTAAPTIANYRTSVAQAGPLDTPSGVVAQAVPGEVVALTWAAVETATSYTVERSTNGTTWSFLLETTATSVLDNTVACESPYSYRVRANRSSDGSSSEYSNVSSVTVGTCNSIGDGGFESTGSWTFNTSGSGDGIIDNPLTFEGDSLFLFQGNSATEFISRTVNLSGGIGTDIQFGWALAFQDASTAGDVGAQLRFFNGSNIEEIQNCLWQGARGTLGWNVVWCDLTVQIASSFDSIQVLIGWRDVPSGLMGIDNVYITDNP